MDAYGRMVAVDYESLSGGVPNLSQVTHVGNVTDLPIQQAPAENDNQLATLGQVADVLADIINESPDIIQLITNLIEIIQGGGTDLQQILDQLDNKVDKSQLGVDVQELTLQGGERRLPLDQAPLLTLQHICQNGADQESRVAGLPAQLDTEFTTLSQVQNLIETQGTPDLQSVLAEGNESGLSIILSVPLFDISNTISPLSNIMVGALTENRQSTQTYTASGITLQTNDAGVMNQASLMVNSSLVGSGAQVWVDRLITNFKSTYTGIILTSADFGHEPETGLGIDADKLDGSHKSEFVTKLEFPIGDLSGIVAGQTIVFDGEEFIPGDVGSGQGFVLFEESLVGDYQTFSVKEIDHNTHVKSNSNKNLILGPHAVSITGQDNTILSRQSGNVVLGNNNFGYFGDSYIAGNNNVFFGTAISLVGNQNWNFIFNASEVVGNNSYFTNENIILNYEMNSSSAYTLAGSNNLIVNTKNASILQEGITQNTVLINTDSVSINQIDVIGLGVDHVVFAGNKSTAINTVNANISGQGQFVSGEGITMNTYRSVVFGTYPTFEAGTPSQNLVQIQDRQFTIGSGTNNLVRNNALTLWKSGQLQLDGQLKIGFSHSNETGQAIEGMLRYNSGSKRLEIFRSGNWTNDLLNASLDTHSRLHQINSILDHAPVQPENRGKFLFTDGSTGQIIFVDQAGGGVTPVNGILEWSIDVYQPYSSKTASQFYTGQTAPSSVATTLNYDGYFRASNLYVGNQAVLTVHPNEGANGSLHAVSTITHAGFLPQLPSSDQTSKYLRGDGSWQSITSGGTILTSDELAAINGANSPSASNVFLTQADLNTLEKHVQVFTILDTEKSIQELFPPTTIVNHEMNMFIPASIPGTPEVTGTPISIVQMDPVNFTIEVDFFPYFEGEETNEMQWLISKSAFNGGGIEPSRSQQDQQYAYITAFLRTGKGGILTYDPAKVRKIGSWTTGTTIYYVNITRDWDYNLGSSTFKISNNPQAGSWTKATVGQGGFFRTKSGEIRLVVNGWNDTLQQRSVGLAWPTTYDPAGTWALDSTPRMLYSDAPQWCQGTSSGIVITSVIKSPTEDCFIGYFNTYNSPRQIGYVKFNEDMSWFEFGEEPMILPVVGLGAYQPSVTFYNGKYHMLLAELNSASEPDNGDWTIGHYESDNPLTGWARERGVETLAYRDIKDCFRSSHSTECRMFTHEGKLYSFIDGTSRWNAAGNRGQRNIGLMMYDEMRMTWVPYHVGPVFAGYQFANNIWNLPFGHTGAIPALLVDKDYLYFATALTQQTDQYKITISRKKIR